MHASSRWHHYDGGERSFLARCFFRGGSRARPPTSRTFRNAARRTSLGAGLDEGIDEVSEPLGVDRLDEVEGESGLGAAALVPVLSVPRERDQDRGAAPRLRPELAS